MDTLCGVHLESTWSPSGVYQDCIWSVPGVQIQYQEFTWTPDGVHQDPWGSVTYRFMKEFEMILLEFCEPASLAAINFLWLAEILEVLVIRPYFERFCCANKVVSPFFESEHYC